MSNNSYFYIVFISQIILISVYLPSRLLNRMKRVMQSYPPADYPKLYPKPIAEYVRIHRNYKAMNLIFLLLGFVTLVAIEQWGYFTNDQVSQLLPWAYFMLQMLPIIYLEIKEVSNFKDMKKVNLTTTRKATLKSRGLMDFVSIKTIILWTVMYVATILVALYFYHLETKFIQMSTILTGTNVFFMSIVFWNIRGKKIDPHLSDNDRMKVLKLMVTSLFYISIGISAFFIITMIISNFELKYLQPVVMSLYVQAITMVSIISRLRTLKLEDIDFDVYKEAEIVTI